MAVFGAQAVVSLVLLSFLQKISPIYSFGRWLLTNQNLVRYLHPTNEELKKLSGSGNRSSNGKKSSRHNKGDAPDPSLESFSVPRSIELNLTSAPLAVFDILPLRFYAEFIWLLDFTVATFIVVTLTYIHEHYLFPHSNEYGLSSLWCFLLIIFSLKPLLGIVSTYKISQNSGEIVLCCIFGFFFLVSSMIILIVNDKILEFHIVSAHDLFTKAANEFLSKRELSTIGEGSLVTFRIVLALISGFVGSLLTFPGLRIAKCHIDSLVMMQDRPGIQVLMYTDFLFPLFLLSLWVPPISRNPLIAYLNTACTKLEAMRKEAGKVTNIEIQSSVTQVFYYLCVVTIQLAAPVTLIAATVMMARSFTSATLPPPTAAVLPSEGAGAGTEDLVDSLKGQVQGFTVTLTELRTVFSSHLLQCVTSYFTWFILYAWTVTTYFGMFYHTYLVRG